MAGSTPHLGFNTLEDTDLVEVEPDINYNFRRADSWIKPLIEYQMTDEESITGSDLPREIGFKYYKWYSNSLWSARSSGATTVYQDPNTTVSTWSTSFGSFVSGYSSQDELENKVAVNVFNGWVTWRGRVVLNGGSSVLPSHVVSNFITLNSDLIPTRARYFTVGAGDAAAAADPQVFRVFIPPASSSDKRMEFIKYGGAAATVADRYVCLNTIRYPLNDTVV